MAGPDKNIQAIHRRPAQSGKVSYGDAIVLHNTSKSRVTLVPFFIPHSDHTELAVKITTYRKRPPPDDWAVVEEKSLSLNEAATRRALAALQEHLQVAKQDEDGRYLLLRLDKGTTHIGAHDPATVANALTKVLSQETIVEHLKDVELSTELSAALRGAIRLREMRSAVAQLQENLNRANRTRRYTKFGANNTRGPSAMLT